MCAVWQWALYHSDKNFKQPFDYHPERFLHDPVFVQDKLDVIQPFSVGPRNCIGRKKVAPTPHSSLQRLTCSCSLAYAEMRLILARIVYNFDMQLVDENEDWLDQNVYILWQKRPLRLWLTPVKSQE